MWLRRLIDRFAPKPRVDDDPAPAVQAAREALAQGQPKAVIEVLERGFDGCDLSHPMVPRRANDALAVIWGLGSMLAADEVEPYQRLVKRLSKLAKRREALPPDIGKPLVAAVRHHNEKIVRTRLTEGVDPNEQSDDGTRALHHAVSSIALTELLLDAGADPNATDGAGRTPLMLTGNVSVAKLLVERGTNTSIVDDRGWTALDHALDDAFYDVADYLESVGVTRLDVDGESFRNRELEERIRAHPFDAELRLVYADWLQEKGDPRGEWIVLDMEQDPQADAFRKRYTAQIDPRIHVTWRHGFVDTARVEGEEGDEEVSLPLAFDRFLRLASAALMRELTLGWVLSNGELDYQRYVESMRRADLTSLERLFIGDVAHEGHEVSWTMVGQLSGLLSRLPRLHALEVYGSVEALGEIDLPELTSFVLRTAELGPREVGAIATAKWPKLEHMEVWLGGWYGEEGHISELDPLLSGEGLGRLQHLGLMNSGCSDDIARALTESRLLPRLESLSFAMGTLTDEGADALLPRIGHLRRLDVSECYLSADAVRRLQAAGPEVVVDGQREDDGYRYPVVGE